MNNAEVYINTLRTLFAFSDIIELRLIFPGGRVEAFQGELTESSISKFAALIEKFNGKCRVEVTLNPLERECLPVQTYWWLSGPGL